MLGAKTARRDFSKGETIDAIDSEKSRTLIHELEPNWWILAVRMSYLFLILQVLILCVVYRSDTFKEPVWLGCYTSLCIHGCCEN